MVNVTRSLCKLDCEQALPRMASETSRERTRERAAKHSRLLSCVTFARTLATLPNGEIARRLVVNKCTPRNVFGNSREEIR